ncbi:MAG: hypothetical protein M9942_06850 [Microthrixaceae bacterium]|nr:hypothetical protein [Microthrixaceae bacterium]MCO5318142.1 hypothetical protein [Microthrixaceae bacterium]
MSAVVAAEADPVRSGEPPVAPGRTPGWFDAAVVLLAGGAGAFGLSALVLGLFGTYSLVPALAGGVVLGVPVALAARGCVRGGGDGGGRAAAVCFALVALFVAFWAARPSEHVLMDRDPGSYVATALYMARTGELVIETRGTPFEPYRQTEPAVSTASQDSTDKVFQFNHLLPAVLAVAHGLGGEALMFRVPAVLLGIGLLGVYAVAVGVTRRPWLSLLPVLLVGVSAPFMYVGRDAFSETMTLALLWAALALGVGMAPRREVPTWSAVAAGFLLGATTAVRVDSLVYLAAIVPLVAIWVVSDPSLRPVRSRAALLVALGALAPIAVGFVDLNWFTGDYARSLASRITGLRLLLAVSLAGSFLLAWAWVRSGRPRSLLERAGGLADLAGICVAGCFAALWFLRPLLMEAHGAVFGRISALQAVEGVEVEPGRVYAERSMEWMSWYIGAPALLVAIVGIGVVARRVVARRAAPAELVVLGLVLTAGVLYLWTPQITPDQLWASRRYVPALLPCVAVFAAVGLTSLVGLTGLRGGRRRLVAGVSASVLVLAPAASTAPIASHRAQAGFPAAVEPVCEAVGSNGAILLPQSFNWASVVQTFRSWCGVPVAVARASDGPAEVLETAAEWEEAGRTLYLVTQDRESLEEFSAAPGGSVQTVPKVVNDRLAEASVTRLPMGYRSEELMFFLRRIDG